MNKLIFCIGNIAAWFGITSDKRAHYRGMVTMFFYRRQIRRFVADTFGVRLTSLEFVRQRTLNRAVYLANGKYYVKVFRDVTSKRLCDFAFLVNYIRPHIGVCVPPIFVSSCYQMYASEKIAGHPIDAFSPDDIRPHADKIQAQVFRVIDELQSINVDKIPDNRRFESAIQPHCNETPVTPPVRVLGHFDLNESNIFLNAKRDVCAVIDWDALSISHNPNTDRARFMRFFDRFVGR